MGVPRPSPRSLSSKLGLAANQSSVMMGMKEPVRMMRSMRMTMNRSKVSVVQREGGRSQSGVNRPRNCPLLLPLLHLVIGKTLTLSKILEKPQILCKDQSRTLRQFLQNFQLDYSDFKTLNPLWMYGQAVYSSCGYGSD